MRASRIVLATRKRSACPVWGCIVHTMCGLHRATMWGVAQCNNVWGVQQCVGVHSATMLKSYLLVSAGSSKVLLCQRGLFAIEEAGACGHA